MPAPQHQRVSDPPLTRKKGLFTHSASWIYLALTVIFVAYVFGFLSHNLPDKLFKAISDEQGRVMPLYALAVPAVLLVLALATLVVFSRVAGNVADAVHPKRVTRGRDHVSMQQFVAACAPFEISPKVAAQVYATLRKHYQEEMRIDLEDSLLQDLRLGQAAVLDIAGNLLVSCNRVKDARRPYDIATVLDLAMYIDDSPSKSVAQVVNPDPRAARAKPVPDAPKQAVASPPEPPPATSPLKPALAPRPAVVAARTEAKPPQAAPAKTTTPDHSTGFLAPFRLPEELRAKLPRHISVITPASDESASRKRTPKGSPFAGNSDGEEDT
ncbi:MAG: hypothetical protein ACYCSN_02275 [Acidobacteriaceae bacterium]